MTDHDGALAKSPASATMPPMPEVPGHTLYSGGLPYLLAESGVRHGIGWQKHRKSGPSFVVVRMKRTGGVEVTDRFPLTEDGWASAWRTLSGLDAHAANVAAAKLARLAVISDAAAALRELDRRSLGSVHYVRYNGGSGDAVLDKAGTYDVHFLADKIMVCPNRSSRAVIEIAYTDVENVEISGGDRAGSPGTPAALALILALLGGVLGLLIFALVRWHWGVGLVLGAALFGLIGVAIGSAGDKIETSIRIRGRNAELYFLDPHKRPDAVRIALSEPLRIIDAIQQPRSRESLPDQLTKLASLLQRELISRDEYDRLKADVIARAD